MYAQFRRSQPQSATIRRCASAPPKPKRAGPYLWDGYMQPARFEATFKCVKSELGIRRIDHRLEHRVEAHIPVAFVIYYLSIALKQRLTAYAPGFTPRAVLEKLAAIQILDVLLPMPRDPP
jgi:hypothetical protein